METTVYNILISSRNKKLLDTNTSFNVVLNDDFFVNNDEEMYVCMTQFHSIKSFYACQTGLNDHFQVLFRLPDEPEIVETFNIYIPEGNYDVRSLAKEIKQLTNNGLFQIEYDAKLNKYKYANLFQPQFIVIIHPITAGVFLGFENGIEYVISAEGTQSSSFINLSGYTSMMIKLDGDLMVENSISNIQDKAFTYDKVLAMLNINDKAPMDSITYENDGCLFKHKIVSQKLTSFGVNIVNENGKPFTNMADWTMVLKFEKIKKINQFSLMERLLARINFFIGSMFLYFDIPVPIELNDLR